MHFVCAVFQLQLYLTYREYAFTVGRLEEHPVCKKNLNVEVLSWLSICSFTYATADATATPSSLALLKYRWFTFSNVGLPRWSWKKQECCYWQLENQIHEKYSCL